MSRYERERDGFSPREAQVAWGLISGMTYQQIADGLGLSRYTVRNLAVRIYRKKRVSGRRELVGVVIRMVFGQNVAVH